MTQENEIRTASCYCTYINLKAVVKVNEERLTDKLDQAL